MLQQPHRLQGFQVQLGNRVAFAQHNFALVVFVRDRANLVPRGLAVSLGFCSIDKRVGDQQTLYQGADNSDLLVVHALHIHQGGHVSACSRQLTLTDADTHSQNQHPHDLIAHLGPLQIAQVQDLPDLAGRQY